VFVGGTPIPGFGGGRGRGYREGAWGFRERGGFRRKGPGRPMSLISRRKRGGANVMSGREKNEEGVTDGRHS